MTREEFTVLFRVLSVHSDRSDKELAKFFGVSQPTIGRWVYGETAPHENIRLKTIVALAKLMNNDI